MVQLKEITSFLEAQFPLSYAEEFDNVGLLVGRSKKEISKALICLDCSLDVVKEAIDFGAELIVTHHPAIFNPLKNVSDLSFKGELITLALENNISIYSAHTNLDSAPGGLTDLVCEKLSLSAEDTIEGNLGRICTLEKGATAVSLCEKIKKEFGVKTLFSTFKSNREIKKVAVCNGGGGGLYEAALAKGADVYISGDLKHNELFEISNLSVLDFIEIRHFDCEIPVTELLKDVIDNNFKNQIITKIASTEKSPLIDTDEILC